MKAPDIVARRIGTERQPIAIVDHFYPDPDALRTFAAATRFEPARRQYPGMRAALPDDYFQAVRPALSQVLAHVFGHRGGIALLDASFSVVTTPPERLSIEQRLPHFDAVDPNRIALVHYLGADDSGGTAFYRHRATGFETIDAHRAPAYLDTLSAEVRTAPPPPVYIAGSTAQFEQVSAVDGRCNRAVIYRSALLHSGAIPADAVLSDDPTRGRLTVTAFLSLT
ncbi:MULTISPECIES: DUF6445 family protein [unclassified Sphingomonas]|uniref:DUF6445 family protein n=1 Tax=unclassified Sphingomonas TaxID=196159 RepID=UPI0006FDD702|nr:MULTISPECIES: DUF6445 family protein [unclassified Sphingomonas]KQM27381.1 hypothetical protein ASE58_10675 [Sphingomonas sp. Leaf9]KQM43718.1 hypothetical protein ASE57_10680 [Sphingomonas sp. Leaf11]